MITKHHQILNFLIELRASHKEMINIFTKGSCLNLFCILRVNYPKAQAWYSHYYGHTITKIDDKFYDINGQVLDTRTYEPFGEKSEADRKRVSRAWKQMYESNHSWQ